MRHTHTGETHTHTGETHTQTQVRHTHHWISLETSQVLSSRGQAEEQSYLVVVAEGEGDLVGF